MEDFTVEQMLEMQRRLQEKYKDIWEGVAPEIGQNKLDTMLRVFLEDDLSEHFYRQTGPDTWVQELK